MRNIQIVIQLPGIKADFIEPEILNVWQFDPHKVPAETIAHVISGISIHLAKLLAMAEKEHLQNAKKL